jgi:hypothetical protein
VHQPASLLVRPRPNPPGPFLDELKINSLL